MQSSTAMGESAAVSGLLSVVLLVAGCSLSPAGLIGPRYYLIDIAPCQETAQFTDQRVMQCSHEVKSVLRERFNNARLARTGGGFLQVLTSATSALLTGTAGSSAIGAGTILAGISSIMPEVSNIVEAKDRAEVYSDGVKAIESAEARFFKAVAKTKEGKISGERLTSDGANLYETVVAAVHIMEARLTGQLPSLEELQKLKTDDK